ncbi:1D-myo-inositol 2-acetamido-2-deoxy-alpha-D-glucopyranoside deacetylase [Acrocarpospora phusangensis]|uniref:1D-myo-inositol 2-acetamido-2-deoxy-alpha-D-glucopyranoside deacetylase n=1 Tax=Acrocarpospora phusangensis TaxID=1070424 RepID=A0A919QFL9_9ACTN|nr:N-acetyl-1-D-myo-inositol-2-amino-2-deoxy-alpha-D-glucopyranoside deacetylase [Acrocarpospora phusangensis]GIH27878.1 1D-myo-inositol 2-acetamido-2-deoxy-alpha-D-glucopyranoside deacetylase [Acrocarpospora phusangensis]
MTDRRLLLVHAHPDDETIGTGATMARYAAEGAHVALVTCTLGEEGEIIPPGLAHLAADRDDALGPYRIGELAAACAALGVTDHRFLGGAGRWRDSGMMGVASNRDPRCFWKADLDEAASALVEVIREVRPQVMVTYDRYGFYGHPDHIKANRVAWRAFEMVRGTPLEVAKFYHTAMATSVMKRASESVPEAEIGFLTVKSVEDLPFGAADGEITTEIDARPYLEAKLAGLRAHATQVSVRAPWYALSNDIGQEAYGVEHFILWSGAPGPAGAGAPVEAGGLGEPYGREDCLFAGIG